jgi:rhodanese-related sulfurtransferase
MKRRQVMNRLYTVALAVLFVFGLIGTVSARDDILPQEAYDMVRDVPNAYILDVRTQAEWYWVGHPGLEGCSTDPRGSFLEGKVIHIPWYLWEYVPQDQQYDRHIPNPFFDEEVIRKFDEGDTIVIMCRSGKRSVSSYDELYDPDPTHPAYKRLEELDSYTLYNMLGGFEGGSNDCGYREKDEGWKNLLLPYNYSATGMWTPPQKGRRLHK